MNYEQHPSFSRWELLQALQSLVVYMLLRIIEGRHEYTNFDSQLLISMNVRPVQQSLCGNMDVLIIKQFRHSVDISPLNMASS